MKILIVRHAEPDYVADSITEKGWREAEYLAERLSKLNVKSFYTSPLGRAKDTASLTLKLLNRTAEECEWLKEFPIRIDKPDKNNSTVWDWLPADWTQNDDFYLLSKWADAPEMEKYGVKKEYNRVIGELDSLIAKHGYERNGKLYRAAEPNNDTIVLFCHFGLECVLLSRLINVSPMILWHGFCALPSSVTTVITEERRKGIASFRINGFGDISHLYANGEEPSFSARFSECYDNIGERLD